MSDTYNLKMEFQNTARGAMVATSVGGTITGKGGHGIVVDDPHNPKQALSKPLRETALRFFDQTLSTRLDDKKTGFIVVIMQRLHQEDLTGHLMARGGWEHLCLRGEAEKSETIVFPRSGRKIERKEGDLLWPEREGRSEIVRQKLDMGSYAFAGQYQQSPSPQEGGLIKRAWFQFYAEPPARFDEILQSWDMAFKDKEQSSYVVGQVWGRNGASKYLLDQVRGRMNYVESKRAVRTLSAKWPKAVAKLVEDKANGTAVIADLKDDIDGLIPVEPEGGKETRAAAVSPQIEAGNIYLPDPSIAPWVHDFIEECASFGPNSAYTDQIDAMTQALIRMKSVDYGKFFDAVGEVVSANSG